MGDMDSGSSTSAASAPSRRSRLKRVEEYVGKWPITGATWRDIAQEFDIHHGAASAALSHLHKEGVLARLTETRGRCHVYVLAEFAGNRPTQPHGGHAVERDTAVKRLKIVSEMHQEAASFLASYCRECGHDWPCMTRRVIDGDAL